MAATVSALIVGNGTINIFVFGVFLKPVADDLGLSRGDLSFGIMLATGLNGLAIPVVGALIDRWGSRRTMLPGIALFALMVTCFSQLQASLFVVYLLYALMGVFGAVQSTVPYARAISIWFDRERGLALGIGVSGVGLGVAVVPPFVAFLIQSYDWRTAYIWLGVAIFLLAFVPVYLFFRDPPSHATGQAKDRSNQNDGFGGLAQALRTWRFWALALAFGFGGLATNGTLTHLVSMLSDRGISIATAANVFSFVGIAMIIGRIVSGYLLDKWHGPYVAVVFFLISLAGLTLIGGSQNGAAALLGALLCGASIGAQVGLLAFFVSRYFGLKAYGEIYGVTFCIFLTCVGLGSYLGGLSFDVWHSYTPALVVSGIGLCFSCILISPLGSYPFAVRDRAKAQTAVTGGNYSQVFSPAAWCGKERLRPAACPNEGALKCG